jgi:predicted DNA-binding transcriptional regulator YafY
VSLVFILLTSLALRQQVVARCVESDGQTYETTLCPYRLECDGSRWSVLAQSTRHGRVHRIELTSLRELKLASSYFTPPPKRPRSHLRKGELAWRGPSAPAHLPGQMVLRVSYPIGERLRRLVLSRASRIEPQDDGSVRVILKALPIRALLRWLAVVEEEVEVLAPPEIREKVHETALRLATRHAPEPVSLRDSPGPDPDGQSSRLSS